MVGHGGSSAGSYLADRTSPILSHCAVIVLIKKCPSASIVVTSTLRVKSNSWKCILLCQKEHVTYMNVDMWQLSSLAGLCHVWVYMYVYIRNSVVVLHVYPPQEVTDDHFELELNVQNTIYMYWNSVVLLRIGTPTPAPPPPPLLLNVVLVHAFDHHAIFDYSWAGVRTRSEVTQRICLIDLCVCVLSPNLCSILCVSAWYGAQPLQRIGARVRPWGEIAWWICALFSVALSSNLCFLFLVYLRVSESRLDIVSELRSEHGVKLFEESDFFILYMYVFLFCQCVLLILKVLNFWKIY